MVTILGVESAMLHRRRSGKAKWKGLESGGGEACHLQGKNIPYSGNSNGKGLEL